MKNTIKIILALLVLLSITSTAFAADVAKEIAKDIPVLNEISFENAKIDGKFSPTQYEYGLILTNNSATPTLKSYKISNGSIFVTYLYDDSNHQRGIEVTLKYDNGSVIYTFNYTNAKEYSKNANNNLSKLSCDLGEVYPALNNSDTEYKLYIPNDLTELNLLPVTEDVNAYCNTPAAITLSSDQEPTISITVVASNGVAKTYKFDIKRLNKTSQQVKAELQDPNITSIVEGELFYQKPEFFIAIASAVAGLVLIITFIALSKRIFVKVDDLDETEFFDIE